MLKEYLIISYSILVRSGKWSLDPADSDKQIVPKDYRIAVAEYLINREKRKR